MDCLRERTLSVRTSTPWVWGKDAGGGGAGVRRKVEADMESRGRAVALRSLWQRLLQTGKAPKIEITLQSMLSSTWALTCVKWAGHNLPCPYDMHRAPAGTWEGRLHRVLSLSPPPHHTSPIWPPGGSVKGLTYIPSTPRCYVLMSSVTGIHTCWCHTPVSREWPPPTSE